MKAVERHRLLMGSFLIPRTAPPAAAGQPSGRAVGSSPPHSQGLAGGSLAGGRVSESEGPRADVVVDTLVQGQVVALLQVQEEEPVRDLAGVEALVLKASLLDLEGACGVHLGKKA